MTPPHESDASADASFAVTAAALSPESAVASAMSLAAVGQALQDAAVLAAKYGSTNAARERLAFLEREHESLNDVIAALQVRLRTAQRAAESDALFDADAFVGFLKRRFACRGDLSLLVDACIAFQAQTSSAASPSTSLLPRAYERVVLLTIEEVQSTHASASAPGRATTTNELSSSHIAGDADAATPSRLLPQPHDEEQEIRLAAKQLLSPATFMHGRGNDDSSNATTAAATSTTATTTTLIAPAGKRRISVLASAARKPPRLLAAKPAFSSAATSSSSTWTAATPAAFTLPQQQQQQQSLHRTSTTDDAGRHAPSAAVSDSLAAAVAFLHAQNALNDIDDNDGASNKPKPKRPLLKSIRAAPLVGAAAKTIAPASATAATATAATATAAASNPIIIASTTKPSKKRKSYAVVVSADDSSHLIKQILAWPEQGRNVVDMKESSQLLEFAAVEALDQQMPWNEMYTHRPLVLHVIDASTFAHANPDDRRAASWVADALQVQFTYRREFWERLHWLPLSESVCNSAAWHKYRQDRKRRAKHAVTTWRKIYTQSIALVEAGALSADIWCDPALWFMPAAPIYWLPTSSDLEAELAAVDAKQPVRCYHVFDPKRHPFYTTKLDRTYRNEYALPSNSALSSSNHQLMHATNDKHARSARSTSDVSDAPLRLDMAPQTYRLNDESEEEANEQQLVEEDNEDGSDDDDGATTATTTNATIRPSSTRSSKSKSKSSKRSN